MDNFILFSVHTLGNLLLLLYSFNRLVVKAEIPKLKNCLKNAPTKVKNGCFFNYFAETEIKIRLDGSKFTDFNKAKVQAYTN